VMGGAERTEGNEAKRSRHVPDARHTPKYKSSCNTGGKGIQE
jgi:hypothetical protein